MSDENRKRYIMPLEGLRAILFLGVYFSHTGHPLFQGAGPCAVVCFFILSGFLTGYKLRGAKTDSTVQGRMSPINCVKGAIQKIKYMWALHMLMTVVTLPVLFFHTEKHGVMQVITAIIANALLVQEWFPLALRSINGVSWYLSVMLFIYIVTPYIVKFFHKGMNTRKAFVLLVTCLIIQLGISYMAGRIPYGAIANDWIDQDLTHWIVYQFPLIRSLDYIEGVCIGYIFINRNSAMMGNKGYVTVVVITLVYLVVACVVYNHVANRTYDLSARPGRWFIYVDIFSIAACVLVFMVALEKGCIAQLLSGKQLVWLGSLSGYAFLIHRVIIRYADGLGYMIRLPKNTLYILKFTVCFVITLIASWIWMKLLKKHQRRKAVG